MILASLLVCGSLCASPQEPQGKPDPKRVDATVEAINAAFKTGKSDERVAAIESGGAVADAKVVAAIEKGLKDKDAAVQTAAVETLGHIDHADALDALTKFYKGERERLKDDQKMLPLVLKSIGRHGSEKSIDLLADDLFMQKSFPAIQARVLSLGNIRSKKSVEALMDMVTKAGPNRVNDYMQLFETSLVRLTGEDQGPDVAIWQKWWQDNKSKLTISKDVPKIPETFAKTWNEYWGTEPEKEMAKDEKKGSDKEKGDKEKGDKEKTKEK